MNTTSLKTRSFSLDCIRIFAVLAVIMLHTSAPFANLEPGTPSYLCGSIFNGLSRIGVPLFVMVSGALILDENKEISIKTVFSKYILNIIFLFFSWSAIFACFSMSKTLLNGQSINFGKIIERLITGEYHMWYLIMIIGVYLTVPVLKLFVKKENSKQILYILFVSAVFVFLPAMFNSLSVYGSLFSFLTGQLSRFGYGFIGLFPAYFVTGWYIYHAGIKCGKIVYSSAAISLIISILLVQLTENHNGIYSNDNILVYLYALGVFTLINDIFNNKPSTKIAEKLSNLSFGAYITHVVVLQIINLFFDISHLTPLSIIIRFALTAVISFAVSYIMSKIPLLKKLVRF